VKTNFSNIYIVLHSIENPGNIGSAARAMKNMGLENMVLINPPDLEADEAKKLAYMSYDIIEKAIIVSSFDEALSIIDIAIATTKRKGLWRKRFLSPEKTSDLIIERVKKNKVGVFFGTEKTGLTNEEVVKCEYCSEIPAVIEYPSINIAQAVMIYVYEIYRAFMRKEKIKPFSTTLKKAPRKELQRVAKRVLDLMNEFGLTKGFEDKFTKSLYRMLARTEWEKKDVATFEAFLKYAEKYLNKC